MALSRGDAPLRAVRGGTLIAALFVAAAVAGALAGARGQGRESASATPIRAPRGDLVGPSPLIYPPERIALKMNHAHPAHRRLRCVRCHEQAGTSRRSEDSLIPTEASCSPCHDDRIDRDEPASEERCGFCHEGFGVLSPGHVPASDFPNPRLRFSHRAHVSRGMRCLDCHQGVERAGLADRRHLPTMRQCFECHGPPGFSTEAVPPHRCNGCHVSEPDGRLRARLPEGWMNPPNWLFDMRHDHEWMVRHRWVGADQGRYCAECHAESDCSDCHDGRVRSLTVHPGDYLSTHPVEARRDPRRCGSCHTTTRFCTECHTRLGLSPISAPNSRAAERYHPPAAVWVRGPNLHGIEARRALSTCASCHGETDCVACHGALGIGAGVSPHPPGFAARCRDALETNPRACQTCHGDLAGLRARCP